jgi:hypothetical protein
MALSANGWPVMQEPPSPVLIPGTDIRLRVRGGDVAVVLLEVARRFHAEIERLDMPVTEKPGYDEWAWAYRPVRGQATGFSNHASGTAIDLNATEHPRGVKGTFSREEKRLMRRILATTLDSVTCREVVRWGENYAGTVDGMHFEINASQAAVSRVADRIRQKNVEPAKPKPVPVKDEEDDGMKPDQELTLGQWGIDVLRDTDGKITYEQSVVVQTVAIAQMNETIHGMAKTMAAMAADIAALRKNSG